jgi:hypothetical protein
MDVDGADGFVKAFDGSSLVREKTGVRSQESEFRSQKSGVPILDSGF